MKAKVLKSFYPPSNNKVGGVEINSITGGLIGEGQIIEVDAPIGGVIKEVSYKGKKLIVGTDVELITDAPQNTAITKQQKGGLLFYGALAILGYIVYKVVTTK
jgi:hypothetical protein